MAPAPILRTWVTWHELTDTPRGTIEEFLDILKKYRRSSLLLGCARLSVAFNFGPEATTATNGDEALRWIPVLFPSTLVNRVKQLAQQERVIFFQGQLRFLASEVMRLDAYSESAFPEIPNEALGELLLRAGELLYQPHPVPDDSLDKIPNEVARFFPIYEIDSPTDAVVPLLRFCTFLRIIIPRLPDHLKTFNVEKLFEEKFGFSLKTVHGVHFRICRACSWRATSAEPSSRDRCRYSGFVVQAHNVERDAIEKMFKSVSFSLDDSPNTRHLGYGDFDYLRDHPYFLFEEALYCLDYEFSFGKLESGVVWRILKSLPNGGDYQTFWGAVFEYYVGWLFETYASGRFHKVHISPTYLDDPSRQICDTIVICDGAAILIEAKLATCRSDVRYSGDYKKMRDFLESRLVSGDDGRVGVGQLLNAVRNLVTGPRSSIPDWLALCHSPRSPERVRLLVGRLLAMIAADLEYPPACTIVPSPTKWSARSFRRVVNPNERVPLRSVYIFTPKSGFVAVVCSHFLNRSLDTTAPLKPPRGPTEQCGFLNHTLR